MLHIGICKLFWLYHTEPCKILLFFLFFHFFSVFPTTNESLFWRLHLALLFLNQTWLTEKRQHCWAVILLNSVSTVVFIHIYIISRPSYLIKTIMWCCIVTSTLSSLKWVRCASFSLVFTSGYWFCRNSSSSASSCSSVKMVRWRRVLLCWLGDCSSLWVAPSLHESERIAGFQPYWQAAGRRSDLRLGEQNQAQPQTKAEGVVLPSWMKSGWSMSAQWEQ